MIVGTLAEQQACGWHRRDGSGLHNRVLGGLFYLSKVRQQLRTTDEAPR